MGSLEYQAQARVASPVPSDKVLRLLALADDWLQHANAQKAGWDNHAAVPIALVSALRAALAASSVPAGWQPIATAPKDGRVLLLALNLIDGDYVCVGRNTNGYDAWESPLESLAGTAMTRIEPTHWRPLPDPPSEEAS